MKKLKIALVAPDYESVRLFAENVAKRPEVTTLFEFDLIDTVDKLKVGNSYAAYMRFNTAGFEAAGAIQHWLYNYNAKWISEEVMLYTSAGALRIIFKELGGKLTEIPDVLWSDELPTISGHYWLAKEYGNKPIPTRIISLVELKEEDIFIYNDKVYSGGMFAKCLQEFGITRYKIAPAGIPLDPFSK
jgi:hypothetical protein